MDIEIDKNYYKLSIYLINLHLFVQLHSILFCIRLIFIFSFFGKCFVSWLNNNFPNFS